MKKDFTRTTYTEEQSIKIIRNVLESISSGNVNKMQYASEELYDLIICNLKPNLEIQETNNKKRTVIDNFNTSPKQAISDRWIRIEDVLPQIGSKVWVGRYGKVPAVMEAIFDGDGFVEPEHYGWTYASKFKDPTHWQPEYIPSPPTNIHKGVN